MSAEQKKLKEIENSKRKLDMKLKNPKRDSDDDENDEYAVRPPFVKKELQKHQEVKDELRSGVRHMVKFSRVSNSEKLTSAGQKTRSQAG